MDCNSLFDMWWASPVLLLRDSLSIPISILGPKNKSPMHHQFKDAECFRDAKRNSIFLMAYLEQRSCLMHASEVSAKGVALVMQGCTLESVEWPLSLVQMWLPFFFVELHLWFIIPMVSLLLGPLPSPPHQTSLAFDLPLSKPFASSSLLVSLSTHPPHTRSSPLFVDVEIMAIDDFKFLHLRPCF